MRTALTELSNFVCLLSAIDPVTCSAPQMAYIETHQLLENKCQALAIRLASLR